MAETFEIFTSLRYDPALKEVPSRGLDYAGWNYRNESPLYMLDFHRDRLLRAATHWQWQPVIDLISGDEGLQMLTKSALEFIGPQETPLRLRIVIDASAKITFCKFDTFPTSIENLFPKRIADQGVLPAANEPRTPPLYTLLVDDQNISRSAFTHFKTTKREMYDAARSRTGIKPGESKEVLMTNKDNGTVMEGSTTTPYFWRNGRWVTPPVSAKFSKDAGSGGQDGTSRRWALER
jgi:branched-subunit amino acid aminotransferase/4-amino-4-deoxychorismate lyase